MTVSRLTLAEPLAVRGYGFVGGADLTVTLQPAAGGGIVFVRTDLPGRPEIPATLAHADIGQRRRTTVRKGDAAVELTEHVLSALAGLGVTDCRVETDGDEIPGMDGSAAAFCAVDTVPTGAGVEPLVVTEEVVVSEGDASVTATPSADGRLHVVYELDYGPDSPLRPQTTAVTVDPADYRTAVAPARTFVLHTEVAALRAAGLGERVDQADLLVIGPDGMPLGNTFRFADECSRHKALDVVGDLALVGRPVIGNVVARRSGHFLNRRLAARLLEGR